MKYYIAFYLIFIFLSILFIKDIGLHFIWISLFSFLWWMGYAGSLLYKEIMNKLDRNV